MSKRTINKFWIVIISVVLTLSTIALVEAKEVEPGGELEKAAFHKNIGAQFWQRGQIKKAIAAWSKEVEVYQNRQLPEKEIEATLRIAQGYTAIGQVDWAIFKLEQISTLAQNPTEKARINEQLGNAYSRKGELDKAIAYYQKSLDSRESLSTLNNLTRLWSKQALRSQLKANSSREGAETEKYLAEVESNSVKRLKYLEKAMAVAEREESSSSIRTLIEWSKHFQLSKEQLERGTKILNSLPTSRKKVFLTINWAKIDSSQTDYWLSNALELAQNIGDERGKSYIWLEKGLRAKSRGNRSIATQNARKAIALARKTGTADSLYRAHWLAARIGLLKGQTGTARENYRQAIVAFRTYWTQSSAISVEKRLDFSMEIEPLFREALSVFLEEENPSEAMLRESLAIFEQLRLVQLQQFFGDNCFTIEEKDTDTVEVLADKKAVLFTSIMLEESTHFILQLPDGSIQHKKQDIGKKELEALVTDFYSELSSGLSWQIRPFGQKLYEIMLRSFEGTMGKTSPSAVIFVHDGVLRNIPMAALYDGRKYLAQKWASVSSLGLNFVSQTEQGNLGTDAEESQSSATDNSVAAFGLGVEVDGWSPLEKVAQEISTVTSLIEGNEFLDEDFTADRFAEQLARREYKKIHLATHGYFGGVAENSFLLTYDRPLFADELEKSLIPEINLLVLSACETAVGSDRSALGLAGLALRNGVDSVVGTYWLVEDAAQLEMMADFYSQIRASVLKGDSSQHPSRSNLELAIALQKIQLEQIERDENPSKWAALSLLENF